MYNSQITRDRIMQELRKRNDTSKHMCAELGLGINAVREITKTQKGLVSATLYAIADYLDRLRGMTVSPECICRLPARQDGHRRKSQAVRRKACTLEKAGLL